MTKDLDKLKKEIIYPYLNAPIVTMEGVEPLTIDVAKLEKALIEAYKAGKEDALRDIGLPPMSPEETDYYNNL